MGFRPWVFAVAVSVRCRRSLWVFTVDVRHLVFAVGLSLGFFAVGFSLWVPLCVCSLLLIAEAVRCGQGGRRAIGCWGLGLGPSQEGKLAPKKPR